MFIPSDYKTCTKYLVDRYSHAIVRVIMIKTQDFHKSVKLHGVNIRLTKNLQILKQEQSIFLSNDKDNIHANKTN